MALADLRVFTEPRYGIFTIGHAREHGISRAVLRTMLQRGEIERLYAGVYRFAGVALSWEGQQLAAVDAVGSHAVACRRSALRLYGLDGEWDGVEIVAESRTLPVLGDGVTAHRTRKLEACDRSEVDGIPVTSGARTVIDMAETLDRVALLTLLDDAICKRVAARRWLCRRATSLANGRTGVGIIVRATAPGAEGEFRSWLERYTSGVYRLHGIPAPQWNVPLFDASGRIGVVDAYWTWAELVVELEGLRFHTLPAQRRSDAQRFNRLSMSGRRVLRYTWRDVVDSPLVMVEQIRQAITG